MSKRIAYCQVCQQPIDPAKLAKRPTMRFCSREHATVWLKEQGHYKRIGKLGNEIQSQVKQATGHVPKYEKRRNAVSESNREHPRRKKRALK